jgi:hypothetical protein
VGQHRLDQVLRQAGAVLDAVDARLDQPGQHPRPEAVGGDLGAVLVGGRDGDGELLGRERRGQVTLVAGDPVAHQLDPAVAVAGLARHRLGELVGLDLVCVVADVALGPGDVAAGSDQPGQVVAVVDPAGVGRGAAVADQQGPGIAVGQRLRLGLLLGDRPVVVEPQVAVGVDQAGDDPALRRGLGAGLLLEGDAAVDDVQVPGLAVGEDRAAEAESTHVRDVSGRLR